MPEERLPTLVDGNTRTVGILGWPVSASLSPVIHNTAFIALGLDWVYVPLPVPPGDLTRAVDGLAAMGFAGANVTMPHKTESAELIPDLSEDAERLRAVNTIVVGTGGLTGYNTDAPGFERFLQRDAGFDAGGSSALIYGAGGAARACALALARAGAASIHIAARDPGKAAGLEATLAGFDSEIAIVPFEIAEKVDANLIVNATPLGTNGETLSLPPLHADMLVVDLLYQPPVTPLLTSARAAGAAAFGGVGLLLHQAALSFELWTGQSPPMAAMSAAALAALAEPTASAED